MALETSNFHQSNVALNEGPNNLYQGDLDQGGDMIVLTAEAGASLTVPGDAFLLGAAMTPVGPDLLLSGADGTEVLISGYFSVDPAPTLETPGGSALPADLVEMLAGSITPAQYAQAGQVEGAVPIGKVTTSEGSVTATRADGTHVELTNGAPVFQGDVIITGPSGTIGMVFMDGTSFALGESGRMVLDRMIYDPDTGSGEMALSLVQGVFAFVSGEIAHSAPDAMVLRTPVLTIGVRGTEGAVKGAAIGDDNAVTLTEGGPVLVCTEEECEEITQTGYTVVANNPAEPPSLPNPLALLDYTNLYGENIERMLDSVVTRGAASKDFREFRDSYTDGQQAAADAAREIGDVAPAAGGGGQPAGGGGYGFNNPYEPRDLTGGDGSDGLDGTDNTPPPPPPSDDGGDPPPPPPPTPNAELPPPPPPPPAEIVAETDGVGGTITIGTVSPIPTTQSGFEDWQAYPQTGPYDSQYPSGGDGIFETGAGAILPMEVVVTFVADDNEVMSSFTISGIPDGARFFIGSSNEGDEVTVIDGAVTVNLSAYGGVIPQMYLLPPHDSDGDITLVVSGKIYDPDISPLSGGALIADGPGGTLTDTSLDGGNSSSHGFTFADSLPDGIEILLTTGDPTHAVAFSYQSGAGTVIYSTIPLDYYLQGSGPGEVQYNLAEIYAPNVIDYGATVNGDDGPDIIGYYDTNWGNGNPTQVNSITIGGHTAINIYDLSAEELAGIDVLVVQNPNNYGYRAEFLANLTNIWDAVANGMTLIIHDRYVTNAEAILPDSDGFDIVRNFADHSNIDLFVSDPVDTVTITGSHVATIDAVADQPHIQDYDEGTGWVNVEGLTSFEINLEDENNDAPYDDEPGLRATVDDTDGSESITKIAVTPGTNTSLTSGDGFDGYFENAGQALMTWVLESPGGDEIIDANTLFHVFTLSGETYVTANSVTFGIDGSMTIEFDASLQIQTVDLSDINFRLPDHSDDDVVLTLEVTSTETPTDSEVGVTWDSSGTWNNTATSTLTFDINTMAVADTPTVYFDLSAITDAELPIVIPVVATFPDTDGSETHTLSLTIPDGWTVDEPNDWEPGEGANEWTIDIGSDGSYSGGPAVLPPEVWDIENTFSVTATATETNLEGDASVTTAFSTVSGTAFIGSTDGDTIDGTADGDFIYGNDGNDDITGGGGEDILIGGSGADTFYYTDVADALDTILGFEADGTDTIDLDALFDDLNVDNVDRAARVEITDNDGGEYFLGIDSDNNGSFDVLLATVYITDPVNDTLDITDITLGTL